MTVILTIQNDAPLLSRYEAYLKEKRYARGTILNWVPLARRILLAYPDGVPLDRDLFARAVTAGGMSSKTKRGIRTGAYRFCEYLERVEAGVAA